MRAICRDYALMSQVGPFGYLFSLLRDLDRTYLPLEPLRLVFLLAEE
jgi:hypothetical protein